MEGAVVFKAPLGKGGGDGPVLCRWVGGTWIATIGLAGSFRRRAVPCFKKDDSVPTSLDFERNFCGWGIHVFNGVGGVVS